MNIFVRFGRFIDSLNSLSLSLYLSDSLLCSSNRFLNTAPQFCPLSLSLTLYLAVTLSISHSFLKSALQMILDRILQGGLFRVASAISEAENRKD